MNSVLAFDFGASSGRAVVGSLENQRLTVNEIHRFQNEPVQIGEHLYWDILRLYHEIKQGIVKTKNLGITIQSMAIDTWAVDFGLLNATGELLGNPYHYRDHQTKGIMAEVFSIIPKEEIFSKTGIQFLPFNTLYQLYILKKTKPSLVKEATHFLMIPDLFRYFLTGVMRNEFSNATTTQFYNPKLGDWDYELLKRLDIPVHLFGEIISPGTVVGNLQPSLCEELGVSPIPVIAVAEHDTGSAVAAVPATEDDFIYLSCGTWSLMGTELNEALINEQTLAFNFTNEGGVEDTFRFLKNIMGLWIIQECRREWEINGDFYTFEELVEKAKQARPFSCFIDPDHHSFLNPQHMPKAIQEYCRSSGQTIPEDVGSMIRCVLESLAFKYRYVFSHTEELTGKRFRGLHMVGGGIHNKLLCQFTADALGKPVWAGPSEATSIGNIMVQYIALGQISGRYEARKIIRESFPIRTYKPMNHQACEPTYETFLQITGLG